ncbi:hypothetical protein NP493_1110g00020 [Ridgeia piscesae]|uniref:Uncharacterized protein n=1 Tax=Ridgeia piscesae TaxID=27915 RepID=A0AAD9KI90_RIDPI|nr:hypothetical protein NP493_1110g00020 [Ridgeia piscesae]
MLQNCDIQTLLTYTLYNTFVKASTLHLVLIFFQHTYFNDDLNSTRASFPTSTLANSFDSSNPHLCWIDLEKDDEILQQILPKELFLCHLRETKCKNDNRPHPYVNQSSSFHLHIQCLCVNVKEVGSRR